MKTKKLIRRGRIAIATLFMLAVLGAFFGIMDDSAVFLHTQFAPALLNGFTAFSLGALIILCLIILLTLLFGRFYCSLFCPFGILQDLIGWISCRKNTLVPNFRKIRYMICGIVFSALILGWSGGFLLLEPYSNFGRIFGSFTLGGMLVLFLIIALVIWKKRIYCTAVCPVGTILGLLAKFSWFQLVFTGKCVKCKKCVKMCPSGCIDTESGDIDNERCVRCLNCLSACPCEGISLAIPGATFIKQDFSRREFLISGGALLAGIAVGATLAKVGIDKFVDFGKRFKILPPGAGNAERFAAKCTACQLCTANCPGKIIVPAPGGVGPVSLDLSRGFCQYNCNRCSQICPVGAIKPLTLAEKRKVKIGKVEFTPQSCLVFQEGVRCGHCGNVCPTGAITLRANSAPRLNDKLCIGCGACQHVCPAEVKAMTVIEIEHQTI